MSRFSRSNLKPLLVQSVAGLVIGYGAYLLTFWWLPDLIHRAGCAIVPC